MAMLISVLFRKQRLMIHILLSNSQLNVLLLLIGYIETVLVVKLWHRFEKIHLPLKYLSLESSNIEGFYNKITLRKKEMAINMFLYSI